MKRNLYTLMAAFVVLFSQYAYCGTYGGGLGTAAEPYIIADPNHVQQIGENSHHWNRCFILTEDIDMAACSGTSFHIIGTDYARPFNGVFDGDGHIISNLTIDASAKAISYVGFFGCVGKHASIKNLVMKNISIKGGNSTRNAGGLAGQNTGAIRRCSTSGSVSNPTTGWARTGGLVGQNSGVSGYSIGIISDCFSNCDVSMNGKAGGGLIGSSVGGVISDSYATGSVTGYSYLGGFIGTIVTQASSPRPGSIENCFSTGDVSGHDRIGGFIGESGSSLVRNCYSTGSAKGTEIVGGFMGTNYFYPTDGYGDAVIEKCYSTGKVIAGSQKGGFVGRHWNQPVKVNNSFWDTQTSGMTYSSGGQGKTTAQMQVESTFTSHGWNFLGLDLDPSISDPNNPEGIWYMETYPVLQWEVSPLQAQIDAAVDGDIITVEPGEYRGRLSFKGKNITLVSTDPTNSDVVAATVLDGGGLGAVVTFDGSEDESCVLYGFTITGGNNNTFGGGVFGNGCLATLKNCVIEGNQVVGASGGGVWGLNGLIENCIIRDNSAASGSGLTKCNGVIRNSLIVNNLGGTLKKCNGNFVNCTIVGQSEDMVATLKACNGLFKNCIMQPGAGDLFTNSTATLRYCCYPDAAGEGNIDIDPLFINAAGGNYHLLPNSQCIDAGDPASDYNNEPSPNGDRVNMGAYGNTTEAARNFQYKLLAADGARRDWFGGSVSIDGNLAIVGAQNASSGAAYIFHYDGSSWIQQAKLTAADGAASDDFGGSVCISGDVAIVGANSEGVTNFYGAKDR